MSTAILTRVANWAFGVKRQAETPAGQHGWFALPGGRLEYGTSGFVIELITNPARLPYMLLDPEGRPLAHGTLLQPLKQHGELCARDRAEFFPQ